MSRRMDLTVYVTADMSRGVLIFPAHPYLQVLCVEGSARMRGMMVPCGRIPGFTVRCRRRPSMTVRRGRMQCVMILNVNGTVEMECEWT
jgi:hypothetical protein